MSKIQQTDFKYKTTDSGPYMLALLHRAALSVAKLRMIVVFTSTQQAVSVTKVDPSPWQGKLDKSYHLISPPPTHPSIVLMKSYLKYHPMSLLAII